MKKGTKGMLIAAGVFAVAGIGLCIGGISVAAVETGENVFDQADEVIRDHAYPLAGLIHFGKSVRTLDTDWNITDGDTVELEFASDLEISLKYDELLFQEYDGDKIRVEVANDTNKDVVVNESSGKITITDTHSGTSKKKKQVKVSVPAGKKFGSVVMGIDAGTIELDCDLQAEDFSLEAGAGEFSSCGTITAKNCDLQVGAGTLDIDMLDTLDLSAECGTGEISLIMAGKEKDYDYELTCGIGEIDLGDSEYSGFGIEKTISNDGASRSMVLECGMGEIDVEFDGED